MDNLHTDSDYTDFSFGIAFRKHRLLSGFLTLGCLVDALLARGVFLEESVLSRWQHGKRIPRDRGLLMILVEIFARRGGLRSASEANEFLELAGQGYLTMREERELFGEGEEANIGVEARSVLYLYQYYSEFLSQGEKGNFLFYKKIHAEECEIFRLLDDCEKLNLYRKFLNLWNFFGIYLWDTGKWEVFKKYSQKAASFSQLINDRNQLARILTEEIMWMSYWRNENFTLQKSINYLDKYFKSNDCDKQLKGLYLSRLLLIPSRNSKSINNNSIHQLCKKNKNNYPKALLCLGMSSLEKQNFYAADKLFALSLAHSKSLNTEDKSKALYYIGETALLQQNLKKAERYFRQSLQFDQKFCRLAGQGWCLNRLAQCTNNEDNLKFTSESDAIFSKLKIPIPPKPKYN